MRGLGGDADAVATANAAFDKLVAAQPDHPLYLAYLGSSFTLKGRDAWMPWTRLRYVEQGLALIDRALARLKPEHDQLLLAEVPVSVETRLVAVTTFLSIPGFFNRLDGAKDLLRTTFADAAFAATPPPVQASFYVQAADAARRDKNVGDERAYLQKALAVAPHGDSAVATQQRLAELAR
jgi:hypothetical protein